MKVLDGDREKRSREVEELRGQVSLEEQREEDRGKEILALKRRLAEAEEAGNLLRKEVQLLST